MKSVLLAIFAAALAATVAGAALETYPAAVRAPKSQTYRVSVNGQPVFAERFHDINYVCFVNFNVGGRFCRSAADARLETNAFVSDITFAVE